MDIYKFSIAFDETNERKEYIQAESYDEALDLLFKSRKFANYKFEGIVNQ